MSHNIDVLKQEGMLRSEKLFFQTRGQNAAQNSDNQLVLTETYKLPITIVFWDISGFSRLAKTLYELDQEQIVLEFLEKYYKIARQIITKNNGVWDKAIGDGVMSWFGSFENGPDQTEPTDEGALDAINAAIELRNSFKSLKEELKNEWLNRLSLQEIQPKTKVTRSNADMTHKILGEEENSGGAQRLAHNKACLFDFDLKCGINTGAARINHNRCYR